MKNEDECQDTMHLLYTPPMLQEAQQWAESDNKGGVSTFACRYPGRYGEAAELARRVLRIEQEDEEK